MAKSEQVSIDENLYNGLQQARKKKVRNFVLFGKGAEVVGLIVQKKAINDGVVQKAKAECKGNVVIRGVCHGEGVDLKFEVVGEDPGITPKKLKHFIAERTDLALKPYWAMVPKLTAVLDHEETAPDAAATTSETATPMARKEDLDLAAECKRLKSALYPQIKPAVVANPGQKDAIVRLLGLADRHEKSSQFANAIQYYQELSEQLSSLQPTQQSARTTQQPAQSTQKNGRELAAECKRLKSALYPQIKPAVVANPGQKDAIVRLLGLADKLEKAAELVGAIQTYQQLNMLLTSLQESSTPQPAAEPATAQQASESATPQAHAAKFERACQHLQAALKIVDQLELVIQAADSVTRRHPDTDFSKTCQHLQAALKIVDQLDSVLREWSP